MPDQANSDAEQQFVDLEIVNEKGLHARASARFVKCAEQFDADIVVHRGDQSVGATSIMGLMMLEGYKGVTIRVVAKGRDAEAALAAIKTLVDAGFDEN